MLDYIVDANVIISFLISGRASHKSILRNFRFLAPEFILSEIKEYEQVVFGKTKLNNEQLRSYTLDIFRELTILPSYFPNPATLLSSQKMLEKIDPKDTQYLALSLQLDLILLTRDKPLYRGLQKKGYKKVMLFDDFLRNI